MNADQERDAAHSIARGVRQFYEGTAPPTQIRIALQICRRPGLQFNRVWGATVDEILGVLDAAEWCEWRPIVLGQWTVWVEAYCRRGRPCRGFANLDLLADVA
jgi:hypothetical protein